MAINPVKPEFMGSAAISLSGKESEIFAIVLENWPTSALEIAGHFNEPVSSREEKKKASTKYVYYLQKLVDKQLLLSKRVGNAMVVWPIRAEKLRAIHSILDHREAP